MARKQDQRRWRANTSRRRIEVCLPAEVAERLDALVAARGRRRAAVIAELIETAELPAGASDEGVQAELLQPGGQRVDEARGPAASAVASPSPLAVPPYTLRRPRAEREKKYAWIVVADDGAPVCGIKRNADYGPRWCGRYLKTTWSTTWAKGRTRDEVAADLLRLPEIYR